MYTTFSMDQPGQADEASKISIPVVLRLFVISDKVKKVDPQSRFQSGG
jgi:hypothetical protein